MSSPEQSMGTRWGTVKYSIDWRQGRAPQPPSFRPVSFGPYGQNYNYFAHRETMVLYRRAFEDGDDVSR